LSQDLAEGEQREKTQCQQGHQRKLGPQTAAAAFDNEGSPGAGEPEPGAIESETETRAHEQQARVPHTGLNGGKPDAREKDDRQKENGQVPAEIPETDPDREGLSRSERESRIRHRLRIHGTGE
jgi:hypothetical protein